MDKTELKKRHIRKIILAKLAKHRSCAMEDSRVLEKGLLTHPKFQKAKIIALYVSLPGEVVTRPIIRKALKAGKCVVLPRCFSDSSELCFYRIDSLKSLQKNSYGIWEPQEEKKQEVSPKQIDLVVVPAVALDKKGNRLGRGKGYYDRFLKKIKKNTFTVSLAFKCQMVPKIPVTRHDRPVQAVLVS